MPQDNQPKLDPEREKRFNEEFSDIGDLFSLDPIKSFLAQEIENVTQECYLECLAVECGEGECAEAIRTKFPELITKLEEE